MEIMLRMLKSVVLVDAGELNSAFSANKKTSLNGITTGSSQQTRRSTASAAKGTYPNDDEGRQAASGNR